MDTLQILDALEETMRADRSDGQLLDLFVRARDEEAFAAVVRRHGPMVLGVCRRILRNAADADDAFQAAFLVLARKAASIGTRHLLAQWLYGVAYNTARKLRQANSRRAARETPLADAPEPSANAPNARDDLLAILDEELNQLPERYRAVIVLCDLEGLSRREAAARLACPEGTVAGRLARARDLLAQRLTARGVAPAAGLLVAVLTEQASLAVPPTMVIVVLRAVGVDCLAQASAKGLISPRVADTTEGVLRAMFLTKLRKASVVLCCGLALACGFGAWHFANAQPAPGVPTLPLVTDKGVPPPMDQPPKKPADAKVSQKVLAVFSLHKLSEGVKPEELRKGLVETFPPNSGATIALLTADNALLVYADAKTVADIEQALDDLGAKSARMPSVVRLTKDTDSVTAARIITRAFGEKSEVTVVAVPDENSLLVHANRKDTKRILDLLGKSAIAEPAKEAAKPAQPAVKTVSVHFEKAPWDEVLDWYAKETGLTLITTVKPVGTLTLKPGKDRKFTMGEVTDLLNEALTQQKFILIRREKTFLIHPADEKIDPALIPRVELKDLPTRGNTELAEVQITLANLDAGEVRNELRKLLTPFGEIAFAKGKLLIVRDTVANIRRILDTLEALDKPEKPASPLVPDFDRGGFDRGGADPPKPKTYSVKFDKTPWKDVFAWYAYESGLWLKADKLPTGTFTLPPQAPPAGGSTLHEITEHINAALLAQKWLLVRGEKEFTVIPADEKVDPKWVPRIKPEELARRGKHDLVWVLIQPDNLPLEEVAEAVRKMTGPFGEVTVLIKAGAVAVQDTAGNLWNIVKTVRDLDAKAGPKKGS